MSHTLNPYTPQQVGEVAVNLTTGAFRLASVVKRYGPESFREGRGDTVYLNVPGALTAHSRGMDDTTVEIVIDELRESQEPIALDVKAYSAVQVNDKDLSLDIQDFSRQILQPQADAVAAKVESTLARVFDAVPVTETFDFDPADPVAVFTKGRRALRDKGIDVASADLVALVGGSVADTLLDSGKLDQAATGTSEALRNASIGRLRGFDVIESSVGVEPDEILFMTRGAVALCYRAPVAPQGAAFASTVTADSFSLRYVRDYDVRLTSEVSVLDTFIGASILPLYKVERTDDVGKQGDPGYTRGSATVTEVAGGALVKVDTKVTGA